MIEDGELDDLDDFSIDSFSDDEISLISDDNDSESKLNNNILYNQFRALSLKNFVLYKRQRKTIFCQIIFPILLIITIACMQVVVDDLIPQQSNQFIVPSRVQLYPQSFGYTADLDYFLRYWIVDNTISQVSGELSQFNVQSGLLGNISQFSYFTPKWVNISQCPFFEHKESLLNAQQDIRDLYEDLNQYSASHISRSYLKYESPDGVVVLNEVDISSGKLNYDIMYSDNLVYTRREKMRIPSKIRFELNSLVHSINSAFSKQSNCTTITASIQGFPYWKSPVSFDLNDIVGPMLVPFAIGFLIPIFMHTIVLEKENRVREMMKMMGMKMSTYWIINYIFDYIVYIIVSSLFIIIELCVKARIFTQTDFSIIFIFFVLWGHCQISLSFFLSTFFSKSSLSSVFGYLIVVISVISGIALNQFLYPEPNSLPIYFVFWPLLLFDRVIFLLFQACSNYHCLTTSALWTFDSELPKLLILLIFETIFFYILAMYFDRIIPGTYGVSEHPLFCLKSSNSKKVTEFPTEDQFGWYEDETEDTDVLIERQKIENGYRSTLTIDGLKKLYDSSSIFPNYSKKSLSQFALKGIYMSIESGECLGLLGPNGAGKTTLISILTGLYSPSSGIAYIDDYDIRYDMNQIRQLIGICPQFDIQWDTLTPFEHVVFYSRLKGIKTNNESEHVLNLLKQVGLEKCAYSKYSKELSGGMRRRLSVAMALAGNPKIVYLDEPTSGLDPISKRQLWDIVSLSKENRSIILTTHSMEEADILCDKISIIAKGRLQCIGSPLHLKNKFGHGYRLYITSLNDSIEITEQIVEFIQSIIEGSEIIEQYENTLIFQIPIEYQNSKKLTKLFSSMELYKDENNIEQWTITQTSLEDVFLSIIQKPDDTDLI